MALFGILACSRNSASSSSSSGQAAGTSEPNANPAESSTAPGVTEVAGISFTERTANVAFSPDGKWLAHVDGGELVIRSVIDRMPEAARVSLGTQRVMGMAFGGNLALGVLVLDEIGEGALLSFRGPAWKPAQKSGLGSVAPRVVVGHPSEPQVLVAPRPAIEWGRNEAQEESMNEGFAAYDLLSGELEGGAGPIGSTADQLTLSWTAEGPQGMRLGALRRWSLADGTEQARTKVTDGTDVCQVIPRGEAPPLLGWASPPRVGALGSAPVALGDLGDLLYQLVAQPDGLAVAIVLRQKQGHVEQVTAQVLVEGKRREQFPLAWPLAGAAVHPTLPLFAWIEGQPGSAGTLRLVRLTDGSALRPDESLQLSQ